MSQVLTTPPAQGVELGYAQAISDYTNATTSFTDVAGITTTVTVGARPVMIEFWCGQVSNSASSGGVTINIMEDGVDVGRMGHIFNVTTAFTPVSLKIRRAPAAGSHTYKVQAKSSFSGTSTLAATGGLAPMYISVVQI